MALMTETLDKIRGFMTLPVAWHYGSGGPIGYDVREKALELCRTATRFGLRRSDAFPDENRGISVSFYDSDRTISILIDKDLLFGFIIDVNNEIVDSDYEVSESQILEKLWSFSSPIRTLSASSTLNTGNLSGIELHRLLSLGRAPVAEAGYQRYALSVLRGSEPQFASTSGNGTLQIS